LSAAAGEAFRKEFAGRNCRKTWRDAGGSIQLESLKRAGLTGYAVRRLVPARLY
jgi:hypothetical protein